MRRGGEEHGGDLLPGVEYAVSVRVRVEPDLDRAHPHVVGYLGGKGQLPLLHHGGAHGIGRHHLDDGRLGVAHHVNGSGSGGGGAARLARVPELGGDGGERQVLAGLAVGDLYHELVGEAGIGKGARAPEQAGDRHRYPVDAQVVHRVDLHQHVLALGDARVVRGKADGDRGGLIGDDLDVDRLLGAMRVQVVEADAVGVDGFHLELEHVLVRGGRVERRQLHRELVGRLLQQLGVIDLGGDGAAGDREAQGVDTHVVESVDIDEQPAALHHPRARQRRHDVHHRPLVHPYRVADLAFPGVVGGVARHDLDPDVVLSVRIKDEVGYGVGDLHQPVDVDELLVLRRVDIDGADGLEIARLDARDNPQRSAVRLEVIGPVRLARSVGGIQLEPVDLDVVVGAEAEGEVRGLGGAIGPLGPGDRDLGVDVVGLTDKGDLVAVDRAVGVGDHGRQQDGLVGADQPGGDLHHVALGDGVGAAAGSVADGQLGRVALFDALVNFAERRQDVRLVPYRALVQGAHDLYAVGVYLDILDADGAIVGGDHAYLDAEGAGGDVLPIAGRGDAELGRHVL